ncbi:pectin lyase fold/virulence factor [Baffinella frigidus]|nr:pectin lyase fold/virulence factor [Cryptophyta sp. CCMP2293]
MLSTGASFNGVLCGFPVFNAPPAAEQAVEGYEGGVFRPEHRAAGYAVVKRKGVGGVIQTSNHDAPWTLNPQSSPVSETSQPLMRKVPCGYKKRGNNPKPDMGPYTPYKYYLVESGFLASTPADTKQELEVYFVFNEPQRKAKTTRAAVPPTTKVDIVPPTLTDAPVDLGAASEITPDEFSEQVTGLVERLSLTEAATISDAPRPLVGAGQGAAGALGGALALKTEGNEHFRVGHYLPALALYSDAIEMLEGADEDATLGTILCNRSVAYLDARLPAAALVDAERARALGVGKAHFRLAEALSQLGCWKEALEAYAAALGNAQEGKNKLDVRGKIEELTRFNSKRVEVRATPADFAQKLLRAVPGTTLLLAPGRYMGPFDISFEVWIVGGGQPGDVVLDSTDGGKATLTVRCAGRVGLQSLDVRRTAGKDPALNQHALWVLSGAVTADKCTFTSKGGACVSVTNSGSSLVLRGGGASQGVAAGVIVSNSARVHAIKATVSDNEAAGFEVREKGELVLDNCDLCNNIRQGLMLWCLGTSARATRCRVNGHQHESAVTCQTGELTMTQCTVYNNGRWGITVDGGRAVVKRCTVRKQKLDGILVQESGSALLEDTTIHHNNGKGIFIGFDVHHPVTVRNNTIHHNAQEGIKNGVPGCAKVFIDGNKEWDNMRKMADRELAKLFCETMDQAIAESTKEGDKGMTQTAKQEKKAQHLEVRNRRWGTNVVKTGAAELQGLACFECGKAAPDEKTPLIPCGKCRFPSVGHGRDVRPDPSLGTLGGDSFLLLRSTSSWKATNTLPRKSTSRRSLRTPRP